MRYTRILSASVCISLLNISSMFSIDMEDVRCNFIKAVSDKDICQQMITELKKERTSPLKDAYLGAFETIWAKYASNPYSKLKTFNKGKDKIEEAATSDPDNVEIRFVRLAVQMSSPSFLNYKDNIEDDETFIQEHLDKVGSLTLKQMINELLQMN